MADQSYSLERFAAIMKKAEAMTEAAVDALLIKAADTLMNNVESLWRKAMGHLGVTGNAYASITIGVYKGRKLIYVSWNGKRVKRPTMATLARGEAYPLPMYYDGDPVKGKPYVGEVGFGGVWGQQLGPWVMYAQRYKKSVAGNDWSMVVAIPVVYAGYNDKIVRAMQNIMDAIPTVVESGKVRVDTLHEGGLFDTGGAPF